MNWVGLAALLLAAVTAASSDNAATRTGALLACIALTLCALWLRRKMTTRTRLWLLQNIGLAILAITLTGGAIWSMNEESSRRDASARGELFQLADVSTAVNKDTFIVKLAITTGSSPTTITDLRMTEIIAEPDACGGGDGIDLVLSPQAAIQQQDDGSTVLLGHQVERASGGTIPTSVAQWETTCNYGTTATLRPQVVMEASSARSFTVGLPRQMSVVSGSVGGVDTRSTSIPSDGYTPPSDEFNRSRPGSVVSTAFTMPTNDSNLRRYQYILTITARDSRGRCASAAVDLRKSKESDNSVTSLDEVLESVGNFVSRSDLSC